MKKTIAFLAALLLLLPSCSTETGGKNESGEIILPSGEGGSVTSQYIDLDNLQFEAKPGVIDTTLRHAADITSFKDRYQVADFLSAPKTFIDGEYTYVLRLFPEELSTGEEYDAYVMDSDKINFDVEVYRNNDYSAPVEMIPLEGMAEKRYALQAFAYDPTEKQFYLIANEEIEGEYTLVMYSFSRSGEYLNSGVIDKAGFESFLCYKGKAYSVKNNGASHASGRLVCDDPLTGTSETLADSALCVFVSDNVLYCIRSQSKEDFTNVFLLCSYNPDTGEETQIMEIDPSLSIASASYDAENKVLYYSDLSDIYALKNGEAKKVLSTYGTSSTVQYIQNGYIMMLIGHNQLSVYLSEPEQTPLDQNQITLRICAYGGSEDSYIGQQALDVMNVTGLSVVYEYTYLSNDESEYVNTMAKKLLSGDTDFDLFLIETGMSELLKEEYFEDLYQYDILAERYDHMIPGMKELMTIGGKTALMPFSLRTNSIIFNDRSYAELYDAPLTYKDIYSPSDKLPDDVYLWKGYIENSIVDAWFEELASNFMAGVITEETAEKDLLRLYEDVLNMKNNENIYLGFNHNDKNYQDKNSLYKKVNLSGSSDDYHILFPKLGEEYEYSVDGSMFAVNPKSPNKEIAVAFLAYYYNANNDYDFTNYYFTDRADIYFDYVEKYTTYADMAHRTYEIFKTQIADSIRMTEVDGYGMEVNDLTKEVAAGTLTPSEAASRTLRYLKMVRDE